MAAAVLSACTTLGGRVVQSGETSVNYTAQDASTVTHPALIAPQSHRVTGGAPEASAAISVAHGKASSGVSRKPAARKNAPRVTRVSLRRTLDNRSPPETPAAFARLTPALGGDTAVQGLTASLTAAAPPPALGDVAVTSIAFNVPSAMTLDRRTLIQLVLGPVTEGALRTAADVLRDPVQYMEAQLSGSDFVIEAVSDATQALGGAHGGGEWLWLVTPKKPGKQQLQVTVAALSDGGRAPLRRALPTFQHTVDVGVSWQDEVRTRASAHAEWLWAVLWLAPLGLLWLYARWRRKHRRWFHGGL